MCVFALKEWDQYIGGFALMNISYLRKDIKVNVQSSNILVEQMGLIYCQPKPIYHQSLRANPSKLPAVHPRNLTYILYQTWPHVKPL